MNNALLMLPDFGLILMGAILARRLGFTRNFWDGAERLVYYALFPPLLFTSIVNAKFSFATEGRMLVAAVGAFLAAVVLGFAARWLFKPTPAFFASCVQTAFRYNSYVGLALAQSLVGPRGVALMALIIAICVPLANAFAVYALARHRQTGVLREMAVNPLILATVSGLIANLLGFELPDAARHLPVAPRHREPGARAAVHWRRTDVRVGARGASDNDLPGHGQADGDAGPGLVVHTPARARRNAGARRGAFRGACRPPRAPTSWPRAWAGTRHRSPMQSPRRRCWRC